MAKLALLITGMSLLVMEVQEKMEPTPEAKSLLGEPLYARDENREVTEEADRALAQAPDNLELVLAAAAARASDWRYQEAIELYTRAMRAHPNDWRPYRYRGHRYISTRRFDKAIQDLEEARTLSRYSFDVAYHLGLAYFLSGRFGEASDEYLRCLKLATDESALAIEESGALGEGFRSCMEISRREATRVAITDWAYRALRRDGRHEHASALLEDIEEGWSPEPNLAYYRNLLFYKGSIDESELLSELGDSRFETVAFGLANWHLAEGNDERARALLAQIGRDPHWPGFGRIAAEADLARLSGQ